MEEVWKKVQWKGFETKFEISNKGNVISYLWGRKKEIRPHTRLGYLRFGLTVNKATRKLLSIHRIVAQTFIPNPLMLPEINHKNGVKNDNRVENLEWCDRSMNVQHAYDIGLHIGLKGAINPKAKKVAQYKDCILIKRYNYIREAKIDGFLESSISRCLRGIYPLYKGYQWKYIN